jgi:hypothetical protein
MIARRAPVRPPAPARTTSLCLPHGRAVVIVRAPAKIEGLAIDAGAHGLLRGRRPALAGIYMRGVTATVTGPASLDANPEPQPTAPAGSASARRRVLASRRGNSIAAYQRAGIVAGLRRPRHCPREPGDGDGNTTIESRTVRGGQRRGRARRERARPRAEWRACARRRSFSRPRVRVGQPLSGTPSDPCGEPCTRCATTPSPGERSA